MMSNDDEDDPTAGRIVVVQVVEGKLHILASTDVDGGVCVSLLHHPFFFFYTAHCLHCSTKQALLH